MHTIEKDRKEMQQEKEKQRLEEEQQRRASYDDRAKTRQSTAPPPSPAVAMSPVGSAGRLDDALANRCTSAATAVSTPPNPRESDRTPSPERKAQKSVDPADAKHHTQDVGQKRRSSSQTGAQTEQSLSPEESERLFSDGHVATKEQK